jgi:hypothetical protein
VAAAAAESAVAAADRLLAGEWSVLGTPRSDIVAPDWFWDPVTGRRAPQERLAFAVDHRDETQTGNVKAVWELSRHHHLTVLASAYWLTGDERYADVVADQLRSWWRENPFLSGVHWTSGIEIGVRLISWAWVRRLLDDWPKVEDLFDSNPDALRQFWWHQHFLAGFRSRGSSANNHAVAEAAGRVAAACAFPWFRESAGWRRDAVHRLQEELTRNTFPSGVNRELATDYHRFVTELGLLGAVEAAAAGRPLGNATWSLLAASLDAAAAMVDATGRPPRQGDGDEGRALILDDPESAPWSLLLGVGGEVLGALDWWPDRTPSVLATAVGALVPTLPEVAGRPQSRPAAFPDAGVYLLRTPPEEQPEIWCRCDGGPHGFLAIAAHAHADALSVEVRHDGVDVLADPGTYCYHGEPEWRRYFRSTRAHNTIEVDGESQSVDGGPFLWSRHAPSKVLEAHTAPGPVQSWRAEHTGYARLHPPVRHARLVSLDQRARILSVRDDLSGAGEHSVRLAFHLGPEVSARLEDCRATLSWPGRTGACSAVLSLPGSLRWTVHRGQVDPVLGWYSPGFAQRRPSTSLLGTGRLERRLVLSSTLEFGPGSPRPARAQGQTDG